MDRPRARFGLPIGNEARGAADSDQCHDAGTCSPTNGQCSNPMTEDGLGCDDGNACTHSDTCRTGVCTGADPVACDATDQRHAAGTCNPATGVCSNPDSVNGSACNDGNACSQKDTCQEGNCVGSDLVVCSAPDQCHDAGTCDSTTGACGNPSKADGTGCNDSNACTPNDTCTSGACNGASPSSSGLVGSWPLDEGAGQTFADASGANLNGYLGASSAVDTADPVWSAGRVGSGLNLSNGGYARVLNAPALEPQRLTVSAWLRSPSSPGGYHYLLAKGASGCWNASYAFVVQPSGAFIFYVSPGGGISGVSSPATTALWDGAWHHVAGTYDGSAVRLFVDGTEVPGATPFTGSIGYGLSPNNDLDIGAFRGACTLPWSGGQIDEVSIWSRALLPAEVAALTNGPAPVADAVLDCNDGDPCTDDSCAPASGCVHASNTAPCNDGSACTIADACVGGKCAAGAPKVCDDGNACTDDACAASTGCTHSSVNCDDGDPCTTDSCNPVSSCTHQFQVAEGCNAPLVDGASAASWIANDSGHPMAVLTDGRILLWSSHTLYAPATGLSTPAPLVWPADGTANGGPVNYGSVGTSQIVLWATPTDGDYVYSSFQERHAFRADGSHAWSQLGGGCCNYGQLAAFDPVRGRVLPQVTYGHMGALDANSGAYLGEYGSGFAGAPQSYAVAGDKAFVLGGSYVIRWSLLGPITYGGYDWATVTSELTGNPLTYGAVAADGTLVVGSTGDNGRLMRLDDAGGVKFSVENGTCTAPVISATGIYVGTAIGTTYSLKAYEFNGTLRWSVPVTRKPATMLVGDDGVIYANLAGAPQEIVGARELDGAFAVHFVNLQSGDGEMMLRDGNLFLKTASHLYALPVPATNYPTNAPWPVVMHDNHRSSSRL